MVIAVDGGLDGTTSAGFTNQVLALVDGGATRMIIDCAGLTSLTSVGVGSLLRLHARAASRGGDIKLSGVPGMAMQVLSLMKLDRVFRVYQDVDRARSAFLGESEKPD